MTEYIVEVEFTVVEKIKVKADSAITAEDEAVKMLKEKFLTINPADIEILEVEEVGAL
jgi:hypothetical protein